jgi:hypothetical protein
MCICYCKDLVRVKEAFLPVVCPNSIAFLFIYFLFIYLFFFLFLTVTIICIYSFTCILCQATEVLGTPESRHMVMASLVQQSTVLCRFREKLTRPLLDDDETCPPMPTAKESLCLSHNIGPAPHVNSCGHKMHAECFNKYYENAVQKESRRSFRRLTPPFDVEKEEFMCPLCNNLSNSVLPIIQSLDSYTMCSEDELQIELTLDDWLDMIETFYGYLVSDILMCNVGVMQRPYCTVNV